MDNLESNYRTYFSDFVTCVSNNQRSKSHKSPKIKFIESKILYNFQIEAKSINLYLKYQYKINSICIESNKPVLIGIDNLTREVLKCPIIGLKNYLEENFKIKLNSFNLDNLLSKYKLKVFIKLKLYQLINFDLEHTNIFINDRQLIYYFMNMTYEQLFNYYINNINNFHFNEHDIIIPNFPTIFKVINDKKSELKKKGKKEGYINRIIEKFRTISKNIIEDIREGTLNNEEEAIEKMIIKVTVRKSIKNIMNKSYKYKK